MYSALSTESDIPEEVPERVQRSHLLTPASWLAQGNEVQRLSFV